MTDLRLDIVVPGTADARARGCTCPADWREVDHAVLCCSGHLFSPCCPVHRRAVMAEVQRMFGVAQ